MPLHLAQSMAQRLYTSLGFELLDLVHIQVEGEEESVELGAMVLRK